MLKMRCQRTIFFTSLLLSTVLISCQRKPEPQSTLVPVTRPVRAPLYGVCDCDYDFDERGYLCGDRAAFNKLGGREPVCYVRDYVSVPTVGQSHASGSSWSWQRLVGGLMLCLFLQQYAQSLKDSDKDK